MNLARTMQLTILTTAVAAIGACSSYSEAGGRDPDTALKGEASAAVQRFRSTDASLKTFFDTAYGYVVFPTVAKGAIGVGGAHGDGVVYEQGNVVGYADLSQGTIGLQLGGQTYSEIIFFQDAATLSHFKRSQMEFSAQASAVAATAGAAANADFDRGVAVFTLPRAGLMFEASVGGQKFSYRAGR